METQTKGKTADDKTADKKKLKKWAFIIFVVGIVLVAIILAVFKPARKEKPEPEVITVSVLEKIINSSKLSTFTAVYNGIAKGMNAEKPEKVDYYVSYEARVNAGIDFEKIEIVVDNESKLITMKLPEVHITDITVDIASLDFIFINDKANTSTVTEGAFKACEDDAQEESKQQAAIYDLARQNAENVLTALVKPIVEQVDTGYELVIDHGEAVA